MKHLIGIVIFFGSWWVVGLVSKHGLFLCGLPFALFALLFLFGILLLLVALCIGFELMIFGRVIPPDTDIEGKPE